MDAVTRGRVIRDVAGVAVLVSALLIAYAYAQSERPHADRILGISAIESLRFLSAQGDAPTDEPANAHAFADASLGVNLFLDSDSAARLPAVAGHMRTAWITFRLANELRLLRASGVTEPYLDDVFLGRSILATYPWLRKHTTGAGRDQRFSLPDSEVVRLLRLEAARETSEAAMRLDEAIPMDAYERGQRQGTP